MEKWIFSLDEPNIDKDKFILRFGGKAFGLLQAKKKGLNVPLTHLVSSELFDLFVSLYRPKIEEDFIQYAPEFIRKHVKWNQFEEGQYAVRSSAIEEDSVSESFAGVFESKLNVSKTDIEMAIAKVWASSISKRAKNYDHQNCQKMAVVIQPMIEGDIAGVYFSKNPSPANIFESDLAVLEFAHVSGDQIVSGAITPKRFLGNEMTHLPWSSSVLNAHKLLANNIDMEFAIDSKGEFWLLQQRPISAIKESHVIDLTQYDRRYKRVMQPLDIEMLIGGCCSHLPQYLEFDFTIDPWMVMTTAKDGCQELWVDKKLDLAIVDSIKSNIVSNSQYCDRILDRYMKIHQSILEHPFLDYANNTKSLKSRFDEWFEVMNGYAAHYYVPMFMLDALHSCLLDIMGDEAKNDLFELGTYQIDSLYERFENELRSNPKLSDNQLEELSKRYGFLNCHQVSEKGYSPSRIREIQKNLKPKVSVNQKDKYIELLKKKYDHLEGFTPLLELFRKWMSIRNQEMEYYMYACEQSSDFIEEIAKRFAISPEEVWNLNRHEVVTRFKSMKSENITKTDIAQKVIYFMDNQAVASSKIKLKRLQKIDKESLRGDVVYGEGVIEARVKVAFSPEDLVGFKCDGTAVVVVTGMTSPDFIPYMEGVAALITDEGGILCHAAILSREMGLPCIVGTSDGTEQLKTGDTVKIDFDSGCIMGLSKNKSK
ncbi:MAG: PEP/pyruvate-binding domain-containing protein [Rhabdochlamydiaceae bacterium]|nr:PEP/pyruvate-binding domain-containing protein [Candidatus Amphrikana amoebophyrae]